jgi:cytochrome c peroxidase
MPRPKPPPDSFDPEGVSRGQAIFNHKARCATCHVPPAFTEPGWNLHTAEEIGIDDFQAKRSPANRYRTEPLRALFDTQKIHKGGFYHDGRFATLADVVNDYDATLKLQLTDEEKKALVEYLKSIYCAKRQPAPRPRYYSTPTAREISRITMLNEMKICIIARIFAQRASSGASVGPKVELWVKATKR